MMIAMMRMSGEGGGERFYLKDFESLFTTNVFVMGPCLSSFTRPGGGLVGWLII